MKPINKNPNFTNTLPTLVPLLPLILEETEQAAKSKVSLNQLQIH